jgi:Cobalamin-5-phosphate synthase
MIVLETLCVAFGMFSRLPVPHISWNERNMRYMLCAFPLVGAVIGLLIWGFIWLCGTLSLGTSLFAAGMTLLPLAVTGGIHMDGFCDTCDALACHGTPERRRDILKDPHAGAFAVVGASTYLLLYFALASELPVSTGTALALGLFYVLERALSGLAVLRFPSAGKPGLLTTFRNTAERRYAAAMLFVLFALTAAGLIFWVWPAGAAAVFAALLCLLWLRVISRRDFGGMSGDLSGWFLQVCELCMLAAYILVTKAVAL